MHMSMYGLCGKYVHRYWSSCSITSGYSLFYWQLLCTTMEVKSLGKLTLITGIASVSARYSNALTISMCHNYCLSWRRKHRQFQSLKLVHWDISHPFAMPTEKPEWCVCDCTSRGLQLYKWHAYMFIKIIHTAWKNSLFLHTVFVDCGNLTDPLNGTVELTLGRTTFGAQALYDCDEGFIREGPNIRNCERNGRWSESDPICSCESLHWYLCSTARVYHVHNMSPLPHTWSPAHCPP